MLACCFQYFFAGYHHSQINDLVIVAAQNDTHNIFTNIVNITFHSRHHNFRHVNHRVRLFLFFFHKRFKIGHSLFHYAGAFHDLRQKHFSVTKKVAHNFHACHQRSFNHFQSQVKFCTDFFGVLYDMFRYASHQGMNDTFFNCSFTPFSILLNFARTLCFVIFGKIYQSFGGVFSTIEQDVFDKFQQIFGNFFVHVEHSGVDDRHVETGVNRMIQKSGMHCFAHRIITTERERNVAHPTTYQRPRTPFFDLAYGLNESHRIVVVFLHSGSHRQNIWIKNNVVRSKTNGFSKQFKGSAANFNFVFKQCCLPFFIKCHHHCRCAVFANFTRLLQEIFLTFLDADGVNHPLALDALQSGFDYGPFGTVNHNWHTGNVRLNCNQVEKMCH